jgi:hypothetical protein
MRLIYLFYIANIGICDLLRELFLDAASVIWHKFTCSSSERAASTLALQGLKIDAAHSSETSINIYRAMRRRNLKDGDIAHGQ